jgi:hypothetical protein
MVQRVYFETCFSHSDRLTFSFFFFFLETDFESDFILLKDGSSADLKPKTKSNTAPTNTTDTIPQ